MTLQTTTTRAAPAETPPIVRTRASEILYIIGFLMILFAVPVAQTVVELRRGQRVQFTDVFRYPPTEANLRQYERNLESQSIFQQALRPRMQQVYFTALRDPGAKAILGRDGWIFYRPDVRCLVEPDLPEGDDPTSRWVHPGPRPTLHQSVVAAIVQFRHQLRERGIELLVVPVPGKPAIYPDRLPYVPPGAEQSLRSPTEPLIAALEAQNVGVVNLFAEFRMARQAGHAPLYLATDTHWTPAGARLAAAAVARHIRQTGLPIDATRRHLSRPVRIIRHGDILEMTQVPGIGSHFSPETLDCEQVVDEKTGPLIPTSADRPGSFRHPSRQSPILVLGDSFCRIYQIPEPRSLGQIAATNPASQPQDRGARRLLPGSAGFISHVARELATAVDYIVSDGGASTDVRRKLATNPEILAGKRLVIWQFVERDIRLGQAGWEPVPLPAKLDN